MTKHNFLFRTGHIVATTGIIDESQKAGDNLMDYLYLHLTGDWGDVCDEDKELNNRALENNERLLSAYKLSNGTRFWVLTEADRSVTTFMLPEEY